MLPENVTTEHEGERGGRESWSGRWLLKQYLTVQTEGNRSVQRNAARRRSGGGCTAHVLYKMTIKGAK